MSLILITHGLFLLPSPSTLFQTKKQQKILKKKKENWKWIISSSLNQLSRGIKKIPVSKAMSMALR